MKPNNKPWVVDSGDTALLGRINNYTLIYSNGLLTAKSVAKIHYLRSQMSLFTVLAVSPMSKNFSFYMNDTTADIMVSNTLDYDEASFYRLTVKVRVLTSIVKRRRIYTCSTEEFE